MKLSDLGERKAIQLILKNLTKMNIGVGPGDDCAAIEMGNYYLLCTTDMIAQKTHIPKEMTGFQIGWHVVAINLSDIAAKGGKPLGLVLSFGMPKNTSEEFLTEITQGANTCATKFNTYVVGGDMKEANELFLCGTAFGIVKKEEFMPRQGANPGDVVAVTGSLGGAGAGYFVLQNNIKFEKISKGLLVPYPRLKEGEMLAREKIVTSCIDISDGLSSSLYQLGEINNVGFEIEQEKIPVSPNLLALKKQFEIDVEKYLLHFGGDYELLLTLPSGEFEKAKDAIKQIGTNLTAIGKVTEKKDVTIVTNGAESILENKGYEHFKKHDF